MALKKITVNYLREITGLSVDTLAHKIGFHTTTLYRFMREEQDLLATKQARSILLLLEEYQDGPYQSNKPKTILKKQSN